MTLYCLADGSRLFVKIGVSRNIPRRIRSLQSDANRARCRRESGSTYYEDRRLVVVEAWELDRRAAFWAEASIHQTLRRSNAPRFGEWYVLPTVEAIRVIRPILKPYVRVGRCAALPRLAVAS